MMKKTSERLCITVLILVFMTMWALPIRNEARAGSWSSVYEAALTTVNGNMVIDANGSLWIWGGTRLRPERFMDDVAAVSSGGRHTMVIRTDGSLWGWGNNVHGQLGDGTTITRQSPVHIMDNVKTVVAGTIHTMAIRTDNSLWAWGSNESGQIGDRTISEAEHVWAQSLDDSIGMRESGRNDRHTPVRVMENVAAVMSVATYSNHDPYGESVFAITTDGILWSWGFHGWAGLLGDGTSQDWWIDWTPSRPAPQRVLGDVAYVTSNGWTMYAVQTNGTLWAWGLNWSGQFGNGTNENSDTPVRIMDNVVTVATGAGAHHAMAIQADGSLWAWGSNSHGQIGDGTRTFSHSELAENNDRFTPIHVMDNVVDISVGRNHSMAVQADGSLWAWGSNRRGLLGDGTQTTVELRDNQFLPWEVVLENSDRHNPVRIMDNVVAVSAFEGSSMAITADGSLWTWGANDNARLGDGTRTIGEWVEFAEGADGWFYTFVVSANNDRSRPVRIMRDVMIPGTAVIQHTPCSHDCDRVRYIYDPTLMHPFTPPSGILEHITNFATASTTITSAIAGLTAEQRASSDALNTVALFVENVMRRGTTQATSGDVRICRGMLEDMTVMALFIHQSASHAFSVQAITLPRDLRRTINIESDARDEINITFDDRALSLSFDTMTVETGFASITVSRNYFDPANKISIVRIREEDPYARNATTDITMNDDTGEIQGQAMNDDAGDVSGQAWNDDTFLHTHTNTHSTLSSNRGVVFLAVTMNALGVLAILLSLYIRYRFVRSGRKFGVWVIPTVVIHVIAANAVMFSAVDRGDSGYSENAIFVFSDDEHGLDTLDVPDPVAEHVYTGAVKVTMTDGMSATLSLPVNGQNPEFLVIVNEYDEIQHSWFNPVTDTIDGRISTGGIYILRENQVSFGDVDDSNPLMQNAILRLASLGIMRGTECNYFYPNEPISRREFMKALLTVFDMIDVNAVNDFEDISQYDRYYHAIATAVNKGLIEGFADNTIRSEWDMQKDQLISATARLMTEQMGYEFPENIEYYLAHFSDRRGILSGLDEAIALAVQSNILLHREDGRFAPQSSVTRGDAAIVLYRVFNRSF